MDKMDKIFIICLTSLFCFFVIMIIYQRIYNPQGDLSYHNVDLVIVKTNGDEGLSEDKFNKPVFIRFWLVRMVKDSTLYAEINSRDLDIPDSTWYRSKIGDTIHYKYILKRRFFKL